MGIAFFCSEKIEHEVEEKVDSLGSAMLRYQQLKKTHTATSALMFNSSVLCKTINLRREIAF